MQPFSFYYYDFFFFLSQVHPLSRRTTLSALTAVIYNIITCMEGKYLCVFAEMLRCPVLNVSLRRGLSQGEFWKHPTTGTGHHIASVPTRLKL